MNTFMKAAEKFLTDETGASMVEYALVVALIAIAGAATAGSVGTALSGKFTDIAGSI